MSKSCVWEVYREKIARTPSLEALIVRKHCYVRGFGLKFKVKNGYLAPHRYNREPFK